MAVIICLNQGGLCSLSALSSLHCNSYPTHEYTCGLIEILIPVFLEKWSKTEGGQEKENKEVIKK